MVDDFDEDINEPNLAENEESEECLNVGNFTDGTDDSDGEILEITLNSSDSSSIPLEKPNNIVIMLSNVLGIYIFNTIM